MLCCLGCSRQALHANCPGTLTSSQKHQERKASSLGSTLRGTPETPAHRPQQHIALHPAPHSRLSATCSGLSIWSSLWGWCHPPSLMGTCFKVSEPHQRNASFRGKAGLGAFGGKTQGCPYLPAQQFCLSEFILGEELGVCTDFRCLWSENQKCWLGLHKRGSVHINDPHSKPPSKGTSGTSRQLHKQKRACTRCSGTTLRCRRSTQTVSVRLACPLLSGPRAL